MIKLNEYTHCEKTDLENYYLVIETGNINQSYFMDDEEIYRVFGVSL